MSSQPFQNSAAADGSELAATLRAAGVRRDDHILVLGQSRAGKTRLVRRLAKLWAPDRRILFADLVTSTSIEELPGDWLGLPWDAPESAVRDALAGNASIHVTARWGDGPDAAGFTETVGDLVRHLSERPATLLLDEGGYAGYRQDAESHPLAYIRRRDENNVSWSTRALARFGLAHLVRRRSVNVVATYQDLWKLEQIRHPRFDVLIVGSLPSNAGGDRLATAFGPGIPELEVLDTLKGGEFFVIRLNSILRRRAIRLRLPAEW